VLDAKFPTIDQPAVLEQTINNLPGVLENGLFIGLAHEILVGKVTPEGAIEVSTLK
jgi:ribose 5-phosphate isomerase A